MSQDLDLLTEIRSLSKKKKKDDNKDDELETLKAAINKRKGHGKGYWPPEAGPEDEDLEISAEDEQKLWRPQGRRPSVEPNSDEEDAKAAATKKKAALRDLFVKKAAKFKASEEAQMQNELSMLFGDVSSPAKKSAEKEKEKRVKISFGGQAVALGSSPTASPRDSPSSKLTFGKASISSSEKKEVGSSTSSAQELKNFEDQLCKTYSSEIGDLTAMGFEKEAVIEAVGVCGHTKNLERVTEFVLSDPDRQEAIRHTEHEKQLRKAEQDHKAELERLHNELANTKKALAMEAYKQFLAAITVDACVTEQALSKLSEMKTLYSVTEVMHGKMLTELNISSGKFEEMQKNARVQAAKLEASHVCAVCCKNAPDHIVFDCMHLCLCSSCAPAYQLKGNVVAKCPRCKRRAKSVSRVFR